MMNNAELDLVEPGNERTSLPPALSSSRAPAHALWWRLLQEAAQSAGSSLVDLNDASFQFDVRQADGSSVQFYLKLANGHLESNSGRTPQADVWVLTSEAELLELLTHPQPRKGLLRVSGRIELFSKLMASLGAVR